MNWVVRFPLPHRRCAALPPYPVSLQGRVSAPCFRRPTGIVINRRRTPPKGRFMSPPPDVLLAADRQVIAHPAHSRRERLCSVAEILRVVSAVLDEMRAAGYHERDQFSVRLGLEEALCNAIKHGH